ncbi:MAG TPA: LacI family DNA-binding transcriptional regulator [Acetivibrio clariflavus]|nr:LacI family DNA-binding transcriptional regulator [Acetivibrio clariflavus]
MKITIADIARMANVSKATVSRVINNKPEGVSKETRENILRIIKESGFQPSMVARGLVTKKTKSIGLIITDIANSFYPLLVRGVEDYANKYGYSLFLCNSDNNPEKEKGYINAFIEKSVDGVILSSSMNETSFYYNILKSKNIPLVVLDRCVEGDQYDASVFFDNKKGAYIAANYLVNKGHKKIVFISGPKSLIISRHRLDGYRMALVEKNIEIDEDIIVEGDFQFDSGYNRIIELLDQGKEFTAIFAGNDLMAIGAMMALKSRNIMVPQQVEIIGFDNVDISRYIEPQLSTVGQPAYQMGVEGAKQLIKLIEGKKISNKDIILKPNLVLRETTI